jgi:hypothetical protein
MIEIFISIDAIKIKKQQHGLYIIVYVYAKCNGARTVDFKVIELLA